MTSGVVNLKIDKVDWAGPVRSRFSKGLGRAVPKIYNPGDESVRFGSLSLIGYQADSRFLSVTSKIFI